MRGLEGWGEELEVVGRGTVRGAAGSRRNMPRKQGLDSGGEVGAGGKVKLKGVKGVGVGQEGVESVEIWANFAAGCAIPAHFELENGQSNSSPSLNETRADESIPAHREMKDGHCKMKGGLSNFSPLLNKKGGC